MKVWLDSGRLTNFGLMPSDIANALKRQNIQAAIDASARSRRCPTSSFSSASRPRAASRRRGVRAVVVRANPDGSFVRVRDTPGSSLRRGFRSRRPPGRKAAAVLGIYQSPGGNALDSARRFAARSNDSRPRSRRRRLPDHLRHHDLRQGKHRRRRAHAVRGVRAGGHLVFLFLGNVRATLIPLFAVPVALIGTFGAMLRWAIRHTVSLLALVLAIGRGSTTRCLVEAVEAQLRKGPTCRPRKRRDGP